MSNNHHSIIEQLRNYFGEQPILYLKFIKDKLWGEDIVKGNLYANSVQYYRDLELRTLAPGQGDKNELLQHFNLYDIRIFNSETNDLILGFPNTQATLEFDGDKDIYLFCLVGITFEDLEIEVISDDIIRFKIPFIKDSISKIKEDFGENVVVINGPSFRSVLHECIQKREVIFGKVVYCEPNSSIRVDAYSIGAAERFFYKDLMFRYQKEYRLAIQNRFICNNYYKIKPIDDISYICTLDELLEFEIRFENDELETYLL